MAEMHREVFRKEIKHCLCLKLIILVLINFMHTDWSAIVITRTRSVRFVHVTTFGSRSWFAQLALSTAERKVEFQLIKMIINVARLIIPNIWV